MSIWDDSEVQSATNAAEVLRALDGAVLQDAITAAVSVGWLVTVGGSRDGFSVSLGCIVDGVKERKWYTDAASLDKALGRLQSAADAARGAITATDAEKPPAAPRKARRK